MWHIISRGVGKEPKISFGEGEMSGTEDAVPGNMLRM